MTAISATELPLPGDWAPRKLLRWAIAGQLVMAMVAVRWLWIPAGPLGVVAHWATGLGFVVAVLLSGTAFVRCVAQASSLPSSFLIGGAAVVAALAWAVPPFLSNDLFDYVARGRVSVLGFDPYLVPPQQLAGDARLAPYLLHTRWAHWTTPYPPLSAALAQVVGQIEAPWLAAYVWKLLTTLCFLVTGAVLGRAMRVRGKNEGRRGLALWLWNPALLLELCGSGHNDAFVALCLSVAVLAIARDRFGLAAFWFGASLLLKQGHAPAAPLLLALACWRGKLRDFLVGTAAISGIGLLLACFWLRGDGAIGSLLGHTDTEVNSLHWLFDRVAPGAGGWLALAGLVPFGLVLITGCRRARDAAAFAHWAVLTVVLFQLLVMRAFEAWYPIWWLTLFPLATAPVVTRVVGLIGWLLPLSYLARAVSQSFSPSHQLLTLLLGNVWPAALVLIEWRTLANMPRRSITDVAAD